MLTAKDFQDFIEYWTRLADTAGGIPSRSALLLRDIPKVAPNLFLLEWFSEHDVQVRLLGTTLDDFLPTVTEGEDFLAAYEEHQRPFYAKVFAQVCEHPCGVDILREITQQNGCNIEIRGVGFPLRDDTGEVRYLTGLVETPKPDAPLGFSSGFKRVTSRVVSLDYVDICYGVPKEKPAFPPVAEYAGSHKDD